uniref:Transmembrane protein 250 n=1 Tax=Fundulus heteroclitus TaxID=8078 RepID=A0A3Q2NUL2_FUNHE
MKTRRFHTILAYYEGNLKIPFLSSCILQTASVRVYPACHSCATVLGSRSPPMPVIPIPRRVRSFHGPHTTCMHSACGSAHTNKLVRTKYNNFDLYLRSRCMYSFLRFLLYFGCSLLTSLLWVLLSALFFLQYVSVRVLLRLQYKLSVILLLLGHRRLDFSVLNDLIIYSMHITMFLVGGLGWCFMVFVDM